jgi:hypothetical protein
MDISKKFIEYLKTKIPEFQTSNKRGQFLFTCPAPHKLKKDLPSAMFTTDDVGKVMCLECGYKGTIYSVVKMLEVDKANWTDAQITEYLIESLDLDVYKEFDAYKNYGWSLIPIGKDSKIPVEEGWQNSNYKNKVDWIRFSSKGYNIGLKTGKDSNVTIIDADTYKEANDVALRTELMKLLEDSNTLRQKSPRGGTHFIFQFDEEIPQGVNFGNSKIDTRNSGGYVVIQPSKTLDGKYEFLNLGNEIKKIPEELKKKLIELKPVKASVKGIDESKLDNALLSAQEVAGVKTLKEGEGRNDLLISMGGVLSHKYDIERTAEILMLISQTFFVPPLSKVEIMKMLQQLDRYRKGEDLTLEKQVYEYLKQQGEVTAKDVMESLKINRAIIDKYLSKFVKERKAIRFGRGRYKYREKIEWSDQHTELGVTLPYKIAYFNEISSFQAGDIILIGGRTNVGKTTIAMNFIQTFVKQNLKPYYIYSESGSRFQKIEKILNIPTGSYFHAYHSNPLSIEIEPNSVTIIDWLLVEDKSETDVVFKHLNEEMQSKGGLLIIFTQLKENDEWFAKNMALQFPSFATKYIYDSEDGREGHFEVEKIKEPKGNFRSYKIDCVYNPETKELKSKDNLF